MNWKLLRNGSHSERSEGSGKPSSLGLYCQKMFRFALYDAFFGRAFPDHGFSGYGLLNHSFAVKAN